MTYRDEYYRSLGYGTPDPTTALLGDVRGPRRPRVTGRWLRWWGLAAVVVAICVGVALALTT